MKRFITALILPLICSIGLVAQEAQLRGRIIDEAGKPLAHATIALLRSDSTLISGTTTNDAGDFALGQAEGAEWLKVSFVGYQEEVIKIKDFRSPLSLKPSTTSLSGVVVQGTRPKLKLVNGNLELGVRGTSLEQQPDLMSVLRQVPGLVAKADGSLSLLSGGNYLIYLDGREVQGIEEIKHLDVKRIKSISLNNNPGVKYSNKVNAIINISTFKPLAGLSALASLSARVNRYFSTGQILQLGYTMPKASYGLQLSQDHKKGIQEQVHSSFITRPGGEDAVAGDIDTRVSRRDYLARVYADFSPSQRLGFGFKYNLSHDYEPLNIEALTELRQNNVLMQRVRSVNSGDMGKEKGYKHHINSYISYKASNKLSLDLTGDFVARDILRNQFTEEENLLSGQRSSYSIDTDTENKFWQLRPSLTYATSSTSSLELGGEVQQTMSESEQLYDKLRSSQYGLHETQYALFAQYSTILGRKWQAKVGLRYEHASNELDDLLSPSNSLDRKYSNLFFSGQLSGSLGKTTQLLSFRSYTLRPTLGQLSNNSFKLNSFLLQEGNPQLRPQRNYELSYKMTTGIFYFAAGYTYTHDKIAMAYYPNSAGSGYVVNNRNYKHQHELSLTVNANKTWGWYNLNTTASLQYQRISDPVHTLDRRIKPLCYLNMSHNFTLPKGYFLTIEGMYMSPFTSDIYDLKGVLTASISASKSFFDNKLQVSLQLLDLPNSNLFDTQAVLPVGVFNMRQHYHLRSANLRLTYRFNKQKDYRGKDNATESIGRL